MRLFAGSSKDFIALNLNNQIAELLKREFFHQMGYNPSHNEVMSWRNSLLRMAIIFQQAELFDNGIFVEYKLPLSSKRIDVVVCGNNDQDVRQSVIIELKQWEICTLTDYASDHVLTWVGGGDRNMLHPSVQAGNYKYYLQENVSAFYEGKNPIILYACSFLHNYNYNSSDPLFDARFKDAIDKFPVFTADDTIDLASFLKNRVANGGGMEILAEIENSRLRPSKKLLQEMSTNIKEKLKGDLRIFSNLKSKGDYILLDEQLVVYDTVMSIIKKGIIDKQKHVIIVNGGAGTGKSVIGLQLLADLTALGRNAHFATGSKSFTETLRKIVGTNSSAILKYFMSYGEAEPNELDVLIMDESHRLRKKRAIHLKPLVGFKLKT